ncbi:hypothetical protein QR680_008940 [Steinernema hermaphroditum]|uniref:N(4)-(beta-N-acetylglucosaminyl)-L-asparaginase n=1 Tax=Steinernema hermaphroditum TaxID=289476 RepID=A0AA39M8K3_9BILA|nr:hypothetical protein QR680_008940 [Steinernema hermaphroditum]
MLLRTAALLFFLLGGVRPDPLVVTTWAFEGFQNATATAFLELKRTNNRLEALVAGLSRCEAEQCDGTVGFGGSPDELGETTLDALLMDGPFHRMGAVAQLRRIKEAARVAHAVMKHTRHSMLVGESATQFALQMGFNETTLKTAESEKKFIDWVENFCQPNFWKNVSPDPKKMCGPYKPTKHLHKHRHDSSAPEIDRFHHDTIGMVVLDGNGDVSVGTSTNGAIHKIPGRVGDSPIPGAGAYVDNRVGGAAATGDGDVMMRFLPSYQAVESMRNGVSPTKAAQVAVYRILEYYPDFQGAVVAANKEGQFGAACGGLKTFSYSIMRQQEQGVEVHTVKCL